MKINADMLKEEEFSEYTSSMDIFNQMAPGPLTFTISEIEATMLTGFDSVSMAALDQEDTVDAATKYEPAPSPYENPPQPPPPPHLVEFYPISRLGPPERREFSGKLNFQVEINSHHTNKKKYLYSHRLNRIYVDMGVDFPVQFRWEPRPASGGGAMFVRATVVFSEQAQQQKRVERCTQHTHDSSNKDLNLSIVKNVLRSSRQMNTQGVFYCGLAERADSWLSVVVEFPSQGACSHAYQFVCKNSCCSGINRRAIDIVFELEDHTGKIHGRHSVGARVCACPRRDLIRDEEEGSGAGKRKCGSTGSSGPRQPKRLRQEGPPEPDCGAGDVCTLPPLEVIGPRPLLAGLGAMLAVMEHDAAAHRSDAGALERYTSRIAKLKTAIDQLKKPPQ